MINLHTTDTTLNQLDPNPDLLDMFDDFDSRFFNGLLKKSPVQVSCDALLCRDTGRNRQAVYAENRHTDVRQRAARKNSLCRTATCIHMHTHACTKFGITVRFLRRYPPPTVVPRAQLRQLKLILLTAKLSLNIHFCSKLFFCILTHVHFLL